MSSSESELAFYRDLYENGPTAYLVADGAGRIRVANRRAHEFFDVAYDALRGRPIAELFAVAAPELAAVLACGCDDIHRAEWTLRRRDGSELWALVTVTHVLDERGDAAGHRLTVTDISERERRERETADQKEFFQRVIDASPNLVYVKNQDGGFELANRAVANREGTTVEALLAAPAPRSPRQKSSVDSLSLAVIMTQVPITLEEPYQTRDGELRWYQTWKSAITLKNGEYGALTISVDITQRKSEELHAAQFAALVDSSHDAICSSDIRGRVSYWNHAAELLFGYSKAEILGHPLTLLAPPERRDEMVGVLKEIRSGKVVAPFETARLHKDGTPIDVLLTVSPIRLQDGTDLGVSAIIRDIGERKRVEAELRQAKERAEAAAVAKAQFLANISHEIRTPLNGIIGTTHLLLTTALDDEQREYADVIEVSGATLLTLINDILDFSKMESENLALENLPFDLEDCVSRVVSMSEVLSKEKGLTLAYTIDPQLPGTIVGDSIRLTQILGNLVSNAIKFTERGTVTVSVSGSMSWDEELEILFAVQDSGIGIPTDRIDGLFERFTQLDNSTTRKYGGSGLGLAICRKLVRLMGGRIWVKSIPNRGSTFFFTIRTSTSPAHSDSQTYSLHPPSEERPFVFADDKRRMPKLTILVAEDNRINQKVARGMLERLGHEVELVSTGVEAVEALRQGFYDLVFMDLHMPDMDGFAATRYIVDNWPEGERPPVIAMTADAMHGDRERCLRAGMQDYVSKPVTLSSIRAAIERCLPRERPDQPLRRAEHAHSSMVIEPRVGRQYGQALLKELLELFIEAAPALMTNMKRFVGQSSPDSLLADATTLKKVALNLGATQFAEICSRIERKSRRQSMDGIEALIVELEQSYERSKEKLEELLD